MRRLTQRAAAFAVAAFSVASGGCATHAGTGALAGGGIGAGLGALVGSATGNPQAGAAIGGVLGAGVGTAVGAEADAGGGPRVGVYDGLSGASLASFFAYEMTFTGGVRVAAFDINGTGRSAIVTAAGVGGGSRVTVYSGPGIDIVDDFFAYDATQNGGVYVGAGSATRKTAASSGTPVVSGQLGKPGTLPTLPA